MLPGQSKRKSRGQQVGCRAQCCALSWQKVSSGMQMGSKHMTERRGTGFWQGLNSALQTPNFMLQYVTLGWQRPAKAPQSQAPIHQVAGVWIDSQV